MGNQQEEPAADIAETRLTAEEFLAQLDVANPWSIWINPNMNEVELIAKDADGEISVFHGPEPQSVPYLKYKAFCKQVEDLAERKSSEQETTETP